MTLCPLTAYFEPAPSQLQSNPSLYGVISFFSIVLELQITLCFHQLQSHFLSLILKKKEKLKKDERASILKGW